MRIFSREGLLYCLCLSRFNFIHAVVFLFVLQGLVSAPHLPPGHWPPIPDRRTDPNPTHKTRTRSHDRERPPRGRGRGPAPPLRPDPRDGGGLPPGLLRLLPQARDALQAVRQLRRRRRPGHVLLPRRPHLQRQGGGGRHLQLAAGGDVRRRRGGRGGGDANGVHRGVQHAGRRDAGGRGRGDGRGDGRPRPGGAVPELAGGPRRRRQRRRRREANHRRLQHGVGGGGRAAARLLRDELGRREHAGEAAGSEFIHVVREGSWPRTPRSRPRRSSPCSRSRPRRTRP